MSEESLEKSWGEEGGQKKKKKKRTKGRGDNGNDQNEIKISWWRPHQRFILKWLTGRICTKTLSKWLSERSGRKSACAWCVCVRVHDRSKAQMAVYIRGRDRVCEIKCKMASDWEMEIMSIREGGYRKCNRERERECDARNNQCPFSTRHPSLIPLLWAHRRRVESQTLSSFTALIYSGHIYKQKFIFMRLSSSFFWRRNSWIFASDDDEPQI